MYIQVLLPPRTAMIYAHLLRAEALELAKDQAANWDRILEIRHLKDRMIRKCQRLSRGAAIRDKNTSRVMFFTVHAPPDFRMKEMERWFRTQGADITQAEEIAPRNVSTCCDRCGTLPAPQATQSRPPAPPTRTHSTSRSTRTKASVSDRIAKRPSASQLRSAHPAQSAPAQPRKQSRDETSPSPLPVPTRSRSITRSPGVPRPRSTSRTPDYVPSPERSRQVSPAHGLRTEHPLRNVMQSPDAMPIPIPYRPPHESDEEQEVEIPIVERSPSPLGRSDEDDDLYADLPTPPVNRTPDPERAMFPSLETIHETGDSALGTSSRPNLVRRRSSLKKSGSASRLSIVSQTKSVTWAMDRDWVDDQMAKIVEATKEVEVVGKCFLLYSHLMRLDAQLALIAVAKELEDVRADYHDQVHEMRNVCRTVTSITEKLRSESESLQREEHTLRDQEYRLLDAFEQMELKEAEYHKKGTSRSVRLQNTMLMGAISYSY